MSDKPLSELIKRARDRNNLTQTAFGKFFEPSIAQPTIARWEKGDLLPNRKHFPKIASLLDITLEEFLELVSKQLSEEGIIIPNLDNDTYVPNKRHLNVLNKGVKSWNRWREKNYRIIPQLAGVKPKEDYLDEIDLYHADLRGSYLENKSLRASNLRGIDLSGANLSNADLSDADLLGANISGANLTGIDLTNANLWGANLSEAILVDAILCNANFKEANLSNADLTHADMRGAILNQANFEYAILKYCFVYGISDWNTNLNGAVQKKLYICPYKTYSIYVNCLENARLKLMEMNNRDVPKISKLANELQVANEENKASFKEKLNKLQNSEVVDSEP
ncbi:pentapeptide repeat-containing protein [Pleurocapsa sp. PCC 7319]|uniref:pentapeptide repeat-containing protein n=1 Tax=Pleurocapsa sp. PCC 7319 TaxID=118161 RepID=UPI00034D8A86|nr:pentapeptide repeat-containing protein [Pleurocapsa sp. PCC 7319]